MKRYIATILFLVTIFSGCSGQPPKEIEDPVNFYYLTQTVSYDTEEGVISAEVREGAGLRENLNSLFALYLKGPVDSHFISPFPADVQLKSLTIDEERVCITLSNHFTELDNFFCTVACACITKTILEMTTANTVEIRVETGAIRDDDLSIIMDAESLLLYDDATNTDD